MEAASDDWLADFDGDGVAELAVGRLPVRSPEEAAMIVAKLIGYDKAAAAESMLLVADSNDGADFEGASQQLRGLIPANLRVEQLNRGRLDAATAKARLLEAIQRGQKYINYAGHGSVNLWRGNLLTSEEARELTNKGRLPVFVMMTCLNGYFNDPVLDSLGEALLKAEGGGVAVWASSGMTLPDGQATMNQQIVRLLFQSQSPQRLGDATRAAKLAVSDSDIRRTWILLGDPTMQFK
ncbi:MAG TPA: C25 family cysteine peptidase [Blastocatellia bacterium]|nr:C25 family cysteine peptidase [Blastocatellia bacterium]